MSSIASKARARALLFRHATRIKTGLHILQHRQPGEQSDGLENNRNPLRRTIDDAVVIAHLTGRWRRETRNDAEQR